MSWTTSSKTLRCGTPICGSGRDAPSSPPTTSTAAMGVDTRKSRTRERGDIAHYYVIVRYLGVDFGLKRIGLAVSDASALVARPWQTVPAGATPRATAEAVVRTLADLNDPLDADVPVTGIVVGLPRRLDG